MVPFVNKAVYRRVVLEAVDEVYACICEEDEKGVLQECPYSPGYVEWCLQVKGVGVAREIV